MSEGPLHGTLVVEFGNLIAAPYAAMLLADLGARVIKVEPPDGDLARRFGPFQNGESVFFMAVNRGKESLALDTKDWVSKRVLDNLVKKADVVISNLRLGRHGASRAWARPGPAISTRSSSTRWSPPSAPTAPTREGPGSTSSSRGSRG